MTVEQFLGLYNYWIVIFLMMTGFYIVISSSNLMKTVIGLNIFQTSVFLLYITMGKVSDGKGAPILTSDAAHDAHTDHGHDAAEHLEHANELAHAATESAGHAAAGADHAEPMMETALQASELYSNPVPSVLMLTAIVVGIATTALALALIVRIREDYGSIEEDEILELDRDAS